MTPFAIVTDDGRVIELDDDGTGGYIGRHDGLTVFVDIVQTGRPTTPLRFQ